MRAGADVVTRRGRHSADAVVRVVVDRFEIERGPELPLRLRRSGPSGSTRGRASRAPNPSPARAGGARSSATTAACTLPSESSRVPS